MSDTKKIKEKYKTKLEKLSIEQEYQNKRNKLTFGTYTKKLVAFIITVCIIDIQISYLLSYLGKDPLENLSNTIVVTILGTALGYMIKAWFESWAENKNNTKNINDILDEMNNELNQDNETSEESEIIEDDNYGN